MLKLITIISSNSILFLNLNLILIVFISEFPQVKTRILQVYKDQQKAESLEANDRGFLVLEECQFYGEQGGQTSDTGHLLIDGVSPDGDFAAINPK